VSGIPAEEAESALEGLKDVIERRVNLFGVSEPVVNINRGDEEYRLIVELAGVTDVNEAIALIGETPFLEFRETSLATSTATSTEEIVFIPTPLTGRFLSRAQLAFDPTTSQPYVAIQFNDEGARLFAELTGNNIGKQLAIFIDDELLSAPIVQEEITGGQAQISGGFTVQEARELAQNLSAGALPVPIELISQQTVGATLGRESLTRSHSAGLIGFLLVVVFMIAWYRAAGAVAAVSLFVYTLIVLSLFKLIPVTLTLAGIVGFILSIGMAVDANILIFERMKEELRRGKTFVAATEEGFSRAWSAIRDAYVSTLLTAAVLYWFSTSIVRGFALTLALGLIVSLFSALFLTRTFLRLLARTRLADRRVLWRH
jgi:protein-export membrane protein SecD